MTEPERCHCGRPLHYSDPETRRMVEQLIAILGPHLRVRVPGSDRGWLVPRHYIALHGLKAVELDSLGFQEVGA